MTEERHSLPLHACRTSEAGRRNLSVSSKLVSFVVANVQDIVQGGKGFQYQRVDILVYGYLHSVSEAELNNDFSS